MANDAKLSYFHNVGAEPLKAITLGNLLKASATKFPQREVIISREQKQRLTYQELLQKADRFAAALRIIGLRKGDRVGIWATNIIEWCVVNMAAARGGFYLVPLNPQNRAVEMEYSINKVGIKIIICPYKNKYQNFYDVLSQILPELKTLTHKKLNNLRVPSLKGIVIISNEKFCGTSSYSDLMDLPDPDSIESIQNSQIVIQPDDPCYILYSSGTTGKPKATVLSHFQIANNAFCIGKRLEYDKKFHKICVQVPFYHVFGTTVTLAVTIAFGLTLVLPSSSYSPLENLTAIKEERCTVIYGTPTMYIDLINLQQQMHLDISPEVAFLGAAACPTGLLKQIKEVLKVEKIKNSYGMTECSPITFQSLPNEESALASTVGYVGDHLEVKIIDEHGTTVPVGTPGELCIRGYCTMLGYWAEEVKTKAVLGSDKWLKTGDVMVLRKDGYGIVVGRIKDMIIRGGENIFPKEIEDVLTGHPFISEVHVIGLPHERLGEEVCACVKLKPGANLTLKALSQYLMDKIAYCKIPTHLEILENFPKTGTGKIGKQQLKEIIIKRMFDSDGGSAKA